MKRYLQRTLWCAAAATLFASCSGSEGKVGSNKPCFSGIYPHLAYYNNEGECGTGAVVPWADRLWVVTYAPHMANGSSDKLYEIDENLNCVTRPESVGGTPADRMIHKESEQLFIGPYAIDKNRNVRVIQYAEAPGRYTGIARHLTDPKNKVYIATMEEGFYEVDVHTLKTKTLYTDGNIYRRKPHNDTLANPGNNLLPGCHGKGFYSGQGVAVFANNGENTKRALKQFDVTSGVLAQWDGKDWEIVRRNQFTEVTGPGGIYGNQKPETDPIWSIGWDNRSLILAVMENRKWNFYRLPKASNAYDGAHGWNTEWPRIRNIGTDKKNEFLMTMHGMFWHFPETFSASATKGIRPRSSYLKVIGDFARWKDRVVFGCDDSAQKEFLNKRRAKGNIKGPGQSNSNLWFLSPEAIDQIGPTHATGSVWLNDKVAAGTYSDQFLFNGWKNRCAWIKTDAGEAVEFTFEVDKEGNNVWTPFKKISVNGESSAFIPFDPADAGEWIRVKPDKDVTVSLTFVYAPDETRTEQPDGRFDGIATRINEDYSNGLLYGLGENRRALAILSEYDRPDCCYLEMDGNMHITAGEDMQTAQMMKKQFAIPKDAVTVEEGSVLVVDDLGRRWRLPLGNSKYTDLIQDAKLRICREVATERDLFSCHGTFYELPAENADGYAKIRPICSHDYLINDYASYRGLLVMTGIDLASKSENPHIIRSEDGKFALWAGAIDDLWKMGKPVGHGGPWMKSPVKKGAVSDPYLIGMYDDRSLTLSHDANVPVNISVEVDPSGDGCWMKYAVFTVEPGTAFEHLFPDSFQARWIRFRTDTECKVTTWLEYK